MTAEEYIRKYCGPNCYGEQDENGVDISLIRENLKLTPGERLAQGTRATADALRIRIDGRRIEQPNEA